MTMNKNKNITDEFELGVDWEYDNDGGHIPLTDKAKKYIEECNKKKIKENDDDTNTSY